MKQKPILTSFLTAVLLLLLLVVAGLAQTAPTPLSAAATVNHEVFLGREVQLSPPADPEADRYLPAVAYNFRHNEYLVVWHNKWPDGRRDIYARRVRPNGELLSWFAVAVGAVSKLQPAVAYNGATDEYLIVWMDDINGDGSKYDIDGRFVAWDGSYQKPEFRIMTWPNRSFWRPRVAWNSLRNEYLVVWGAFNTIGGQPGTPSDVSSMRLSADGALLTGRNLTTSTFPSQPDVAYNVAKDEYFVVFVRSYSQQATGNDIYGMRVAWNNAVSSPNVIEINSDPGDQDHPVIATNQQNRYIVGWQSLTAPGKHTFTARQLDANGTPGQIWVSPDAQDQIMPAVAAEFGPQGNYVAAWQQETPTGYEIKAAYFGPFTVPYQFVVVPGGFWENAAPAVAQGRLGVFFAYEGDAAGDPTVFRHIYGRSWVPQGNFLPVILAR